MRVQINGAHREFRTAETLADVLAAYGAPDQGIAVALDGEVVPRTAWGETLVTDGARVDVLTAVQGG